MFGCDSFAIARIVAVEAAAELGRLGDLRAHQLERDGRPSSGSSASAISVLAPAETIRTTR